MQKNEDSQIAEKYIKEIMCTLGASDDKSGLMRIIAMSVRMACSDSFVAGMKDMDKFLRGVGVNYADISLPPILHSAKDND